MLPGIFSWLEIGSPLISNRHLVVSFYFALVATWWQPITWCCQCTWYWKLLYGNLTLENITLLGNSSHFYTLYWYLLDDNRLLDIISVLGIYSHLMVIWYLILSVCLELVELDGNLILDNISVLVIDSVFMVIWYLRISVYLVSVVSWKCLLSL